MHNVLTNLHVPIHYTFYVYVTKLLFKLSHDTLITLLTISIYICIHFCEIIHFLHNFSYFQLAWTFAHTRILFNIDFGDWFQNVWIKIFSKKYLYSFHFSNNCFNYIITPNFQKFYSTYKLLKIIIVPIRKILFIFFITATPLQRAYCCSFIRSFNDSDLNRDRARRLLLPCRK